MDRDTRLKAALNACLEGVRLARREGQGALVDPTRWRWVSVAIVSALKAALVAALSGYETARDQDTSDPSAPDRMAPVTLLLRRARSTEYLYTPEQIDLPGSRARRVERVIALRNETLHALGGAVPDTIGEDVAACLAVINHLTLIHPAFDPEGRTLSLALLKDEISALEAMISSGG